MGEVRIDHVTVIVTAGVDPNPERITALVREQLSKLARDPQCSCEPKVVPDTGRTQHHKDCALASWRRERPEVCYQAECDRDGEIEVDDDYWCRQHAASVLLGNIHRAKATIALADAYPGFTVIEEAILERIYSTWDSIAHELELPKRSLGHDVLKALGLKLGGFRKFCAEVAALLGLQGDRHSYDFLLTTLRHKLKIVERDTLDVVLGGEHWTGQDLQRLATLLREHGLTKADMLRGELDARLLRTGAPLAGGGGGRLG